MYEATVCVTTSMLAVLAYEHRPCTSTHYVLGAGVVWHDTAKVTAGYKVQVRPGNVRSAVLLLTFIHPFQVWGAIYTKDRNECTTQLAKLSFNHSHGCTHSWRFSTFYKMNMTASAPQRKVSCYHPIMLLWCYATIDLRPRGWCFLVIPVYVPVHFCMLDTC